MSTWVYGSGPIPANILLCGERPGREEYYKGIPFVGQSGRELDRYLHNEGVERADVYVTNVVKDYNPDNEDPTPEEIARDRPLLIEELRVVRPKIIGAVGRFAAREFIGQDLDMEACHGLPFVTTNRVVMPLYHPAFGLHKANATPLVWSDFVQFGKLVRGELDLTLPQDTHPDAYYTLIQGDSNWPEMFQDLPVYVDTEGSAENPWGLSFTQGPGRGWIILAGDKIALARFARGIKRFNLTVVCHNLGHDLSVLRAMGIEGFRFRDTMLDAYHTCLLPQGLKPLAKRLCGVDQDDYEDVVREAQRNKTVDWLVKGFEWARRRYPLDTCGIMYTESHKRGKVKRRKNGLEGAAEAGQAGDAEALQRSGTSGNSGHDTQDQDTTVAVGLPLPRTDRGAQTLHTESAADLPTRVRTRDSRSLRETAKAATRRGDGG